MSTIRKKIVSKNNITIIDIFLMSNLLKNKNKDKNIKKNVKKDKKGILKKIL
tara:strand:- start:425 stop:580 length:156 start_codon:yes stop_codon:yes gene_type:complete